MDCGSRTPSVCKGFTIATNIVTMLTGLAVAGVALAVSVIPDYIPDDVDDAVPLLKPVVYSLVVVGSFMAVISILGCWSTLWEVATAINLYTTLLSVMLTVELIIFPILIFLHIQGDKRRYGMDDPDCKPECTVSAEGVFVFLEPALGVLSVIVLLQVMTLLISCATYRRLQKKRLRQLVSSSRSLTTCSQATGSHDAMTGGSNTTLQEPDHDTQMGLAPTTKLTVPEKPWSDSKYIFVSPDRSTRRFTFVAPNSSNTNPFVRYSTGSLPPQKLGSMEISRHIFV